MKEWNPRVVKIYLRVPYIDRGDAKKRGAHWEPSTKRWYVVSAEAWLRCKQWSMPLSNEERDFLSDPTRKAAYAKAFKDWQERPRP